MANKSDRASSLEKISALRLSFMCDHHISKCDHEPYPSLRVCVGGGGYLMCMCFTLSLSPTLACDQHSFMF